MFRDRRSEGPYSEEELIGFLRAGRYLPGDLGRPEEARHWTPLRNLFPAVELPDAPLVLEPLPTAFAKPPPAPEPPPPMAEAEAETEAHDYRQLVGAATSRVRAIFERYPLEAGVLCLVIGCALVVLSFFPLLIFGPWLLAALTAGGMLLLRNKMAAGLGLCAAGVFLPIFLWLLMAHLSGRM